MCGPCVFQGLSRCVHGSRHHFAAHDRCRSGSGRQHRPQSTLLEPLAEQLSAAEEGAAVFPFVPAELPGRRFDRLALEVVQDHRQTVAARQPVQLLVEDAAVLRRLRRTRSVRADHVVHGGRRAPAADLLRLARGAKGDSVQPAGQRPGAADAIGLRRQGQEGRLESVLGVVVVVQQPPTDAEHHRSVPPDERGEGDGVAPLDEATEQIVVGAIGRWTRLPDERDQGVERAFRHPRFLGKGPPSL
jgi:hypothetical protein